MPIDPEELRQQQAREERKETRKRQQHQLEEYDQTAEDLPVSAQLRLSAYDSPGF